MFFYTRKSSDAACFNAPSFVGPDLASTIALNDMAFSQQDNCANEATFDARDFFCGVSDDEDNMSLDDSCLEVGINPVCMQLDGNIDGMEVDEDSFISGLCSTMSNISIKDNNFEDENDERYNNGDADGMEVDEDSFMTGLCSTMSVLSLKDDNFEDENDERYNNGDADGMEVDEDSFMAGLCNAMSVLSLKDDNFNDEHDDRIDDGNVDSLNINFVFRQDDHSIQVSPRLPRLYSKSVQNLLPSAASHYVFRDISSEVYSKLS